MEALTKFISLPCKYHLIIGFIIRLFLIYYGEYLDEISEVPYTDIDYKVFTDAARYVYNGQSPYDRHTYRYSPLVAIFLIPNITLHQSFGKILFSLVDIIVGIIMYQIVLEYLKNTNIFVSKSYNYKYYANCSMLLWVYNPMSIIIATRGNADSIAAFLVLTTLYLLYVKKNYFLAGILHGFACHFRIYPIVFSLAMFMHLSKYNISYFKKSESNELMLNSNKEIIKSGQREPKKRTIFQKRFLYYLIPNFDQISLIIGTILTFGILLGVFYHLYGYKFLYETYIYHVVRKDPRHNFSIYFYLQYLTADIKNLGIWHKVLMILPNLVLLLVISIRYGLHRECLFFSIFAQAMILVSYNTVMTSQYFIWFLSILPLIIWHLQLTRIQWIKLGLMWIIGQLAWLLPAYVLEFKGHNTFLFIWLQSVAFFCANIVILSRLIKYFTPIIVNINKID